MSNTTVYVENERNNNKERREVSEIDEEYREYLKEKYEMEMEKMEKLINQWKEQSDYSKNESEETKKLIEKEQKKSKALVITGGITSAAGFVLSGVSSVLAFGPLGGIAWLIGLAVVDGVALAISYDKTNKEYEKNIERFGDLSPCEMKILEKKLKDISKMTPIYKKYQEQAKYIEENKDKMSESRKKRKEKTMLKTYNDFFIKVNEFRKKYGEEPHFDIEYYLRKKVD